MPDASVQPKPAPYLLRFESAEDLAAAWARGVVEGSLFVPARKLPAAGDTVALLFAAPDTGNLGASGYVLQLESAGEHPGFLALIAPGDALQALLARRAAAAHHGRRQMPDGARRRDPRYQTCLEVDFGSSSLNRSEYASNISRGGLFIRTAEPPPLKSRVQLRVKLPDGAVAQTEAEVVHRVGPEEARAHGIQPGVGVAFTGENASFEQQIGEFLAALPARPARVLLVDDDRLFRGVLADALRAAGMEVETAASGEEGLKKLTQNLFDVDLVGLELHMPGLDGYCMIDRIRRLGGEMDLRVVVISAAEQDELDALKGADAANDCIRKGTPLHEMVRRIEGVLGMGKAVGS